MAEMSRELVRFFPLAGKEIRMNRSGLGDRLCKTNKFLFIFLKPTLNCSIFQQLCFYGCEPTRVFERRYKAMCQFLTFQIEIAPAII